MRKMWIDDIRTPPGDDWLWCQTSDHALYTLSYRDRQGNPVQWDWISFDHDLGGEDTTRPVMLYLAEHNLWPTKVTVHSQNPVGREFLIGIVEHYAPVGTFVNLF